jgi:AcrR family transcriptional regulator
MARRLLSPHIDDKILDEVLRDAYKHGLTNVSTKDISVKLGISEPVIFGHFKDKKGLMAAAYEHAFKPFSDATSLPLEVFSQGVSSVNKEAVFAAYQPYLKFKKEFSFLLQYSVSPSYRDEAVIANVQTPLREATVAAMKRLNSVPENYDIEHMASIFISHLLMLSNNLANGIYANNPDNIARLINSISGGLKGALLSKL